MILNAPLYWDMATSSKHDLVTGCKMLYGSTAVRIEITHIMDHMVAQLCLNI